MSQTAGTSSPSLASRAGSALTHPVHTVAETAAHVPGADRVKGAVDGVLDTIGAVSPRARRVAAYAGAGLLGAVGVIEWPVAAAGAAVVWLTQPRPRHDGAVAGEATSPARSRPRRTTTARTAKKTEKEQRPKAEKPQRRTAKAGTRSPSSRSS